MRTSRGLTPFPIVIALVLVGGAHPCAASQCVAPKRLSQIRADSIGIVHGTGIDSEIVERAIDLWRNCANYEVDFPAFRNGAPGNRTLTVEYVTQSSGSRRCGVLYGNRITLYRSAISHSGRPQRCGALHVNLAHELGHALGLADVGLQPACNRHIMASISPANLGARSPRRAECKAIDDHWLTLAEIEHESDSQTAPAPAVLF